MKTDTLNRASVTAPSMDDRLRIAREAGRRWREVEFREAWLALRIGATAHTPPSDEEMAVFWAKIAGALEDHSPIERRRVVGHWGNLPKHVFIEFAQSGDGVLSLVALACGLDCQCWIRLRDVSEHVGCSIRVVQNELRKADQLGFIEVRHPHRSVEPNSPTKVRVIDPEWCAQIAERRPRKAWR